MSLEPQLWQKTLMNQILNSESDFHRSYVMPRGSGVTTFICKFMNEIRYMYEKPKDIKILVVVQTSTLKNYVKSFISKEPSLNAFFSGTGTAPKLDPEITVITFKDDIRGLSNYYDWLLVETSYESDNLENLAGLHFNNSLKFRTI